MNETRQRFSYREYHGSIASSKKNTVIIANPVEGSFVGAFSNKMSFSHFLNELNNIHQRQR
jgi:hypothetical protein